jgi:ribosomal protein S18 acetylase RimI-like enzyme
VVRNTTEKGVLFAMRHAKVFVARHRYQIIATLTLGTKKPWAIDRKYFSKSLHPLYLTSMAVAPELQHQGIGKLCLDAAIKIAKHWPAEAIFLDAYDAAASAGEFYRKCGFREVGRASYRDVPLVYFEMLL